MWNSSKHSVKRRNATFLCLRRVLPAPCPDQYVSIYHAKENDSYLQLALIYFSKEDFLIFHSRIFYIFPESPNWLIDRHENQFFLLARVRVWVVIIFLWLWGIQKIRSKSQREFVFSFFVGWPGFEDGDVRLYVQ